MAENEREFKGVWIPRTVWLDRRLSALDKVILTEIDSLDSSERGCFASNEHIAEFCQCSTSKVSKSISTLIKYGYLYVQNFDGRRRELKSRLANYESLPSKFCEADEEKLQESNTGNSSDNNPDKKKERKKTNTFDALIAEYAKGDEEITDLLGEWLKVRKAKRAALTDRAIQLNLDKLDGLAKASGLNVPDYLREIIAKGWASFYVIQNYNRPAGNYDRSGKQLPPGMKISKNGVLIDENNHEADELPF